VQPPVCAPRAAWGAVRASYRWRALRHEKSFQRLSTSPKKLPTLSKYQAAIIRLRSASSLRDETALTVASSGLPSLLQGKRSTV
jgi:hypothetical protein